MGQAHSSPADAQASPGAVASVDPRHRLDDLVGEKGLQQNMGKRVPTDDTLASEASALDGGASRGCASDEGGAGAAASAESSKGAGYGGHHYHVANHRHGHWGLHWGGSVGGWLRHHRPSAPHLHVPHLSRHRRSSTEEKAAPSTSADAGAAEGETGSACRRRPRGPTPKVLLHGTTSAEEHYDRIDAVLDAVKDLHGEEGLEAAGFGYRRVPCPRHGGNRDGDDADRVEDNTDVVNDDEGDGGTAVAATGPNEEQGECDDDESSLLCPSCTTRLYHLETSELVTSDNRSRYVADGDMYEAVARLCSEYAQHLMRTEGDLDWVTVCDDASLGEPVKCLVHRNHVLYRKQSGLEPLHDIEEENVEEGEADGDDDENDEVAKATSATGDDDGARASERAEENVDSTPPPAQSEHRPPTPTLLITTGKGKVRAGIFSRHHLLTSGIEPSTALPMVREAKRRGMTCVIPDPNARGDRHGMATLERSFSAVLGEDEDGGDDQIHDDDEEKKSDEDEGCDENRAAAGRGRSSRRKKHGPLYVLAHSMSGSHLVRHLREPPNRHLLRRVRAVAFTDSTHNVQWTARDADHGPLHEMLQSPKSLYVRSSNVERDADWQSHKAGDAVETDGHWHHRFGKVRTIWAGTKEHSLTNWAAHGHIWDHFDVHWHHRRRHSRRSSRGGADDQQADERAGEDVDGGLEFSS